MYRAVLLSQIAPRFWLTALAAPATLLRPRRRRPTSLPKVWLVPLLLSTDRDLGETRIVCKDFGPRSSSLSEIALGAPPGPSTGVPKTEHINEQKRCALTDEWNCK